MTPLPAPRRSSERPVVLGATLPSIVSVSASEVSRVFPAPEVSVTLPPMRLFPASLMIAPLGLLVTSLNEVGNSMSPPEPSSRKAAAAPERLMDFVPSPSCPASVMRSEPALTVTPPVKVFAPPKATTSVIVTPLTESAPAPPMSFGTLSVPVRSKRKVAPLAISTGPLPSVPVAPSLPICRVPALIVVGPP